MWRWFGRLVVGALLLALATSVLASLTRPRAVEYGVTFSTIRTAQLNLDVGQTFAAILDDLEIRKIRIPIYWSEIERARGHDDWSRIDYLMNQARDRGARVTLAIGLKVPRWPECFAPDWSSKLAEDGRDQALLDFIGRTVSRYRDDSALERWQVENEPFFNFGECPRPNVKRFFDEVNLVRQLDGDHPIIITTSGEQSWWGMNTLPGSILGATLYRSVADRYLGPIIFPWNELFYVSQNVIASPSASGIIISELQGEPWDDRRTYQAFTANELTANANFVRRIGVDQAYWWGVEWWYYLKTQGDNRLWEAAKTLMK